MSSIDLLAERLASLPEVLTASLAVPPPDGAERLLAMKRFVVTGGGMSEGPARVLVALLSRAGRDARFVPQSRFVGWPEPPAPDTALVLFSQGLAPNARLPLPHVHAFGGCLLVTSVREPALPGVLAWTLPPPSEGSLLLRVVGPSVALLAAARLAQLEVSEMPQLVAHRLRAAAPDLFGPSRRPVALVIEEDLLDLAMPLRWKLLEGLRIADPPVWDVLQVAHGPLQSFFDGDVTLVTVRGPGTRHDALFQRLSRVVGTTHRIVELRATLDGPAAIVELDAALDAALLVTLRHHPIRLDDWPSRGLDGPLYDVSPEEGGTP